MTTETTAHTSSISGQMPLIQALTSLVKQHPTLPGAYITIHDPFDGQPGWVDLQLQSPQEFELWREALDITPADTVLHVTLSSAWLAADCMHDDTRFHFSGFNVPVTRDQAVEPRDSSEVAA